METSHQILCFAERESKLKCLLNGGKRSDNFSSTKAYIFPFLLAMKNDTIIRFIINIVIVLSLSLFCFLSPPKSDKRSIYFVVG